MDNAASVYTLTDVAAFNSYFNKQDNGMIASSVSDAYHQRNMSHQGFLAQANHIIHKGANCQQLTEFDAVNSMLE
jgi:hypothetical protein